MSENLNNNASDVESATDIAQFIALLNPIIPTRAYTSFLSANAGFAGSLADLIQKINDGTATRNDFIDVAKDLSGIGTGFATFTNMLGITAIPLPILIGIGVGFAVLDYLDSNNYDPDEIMNDINLIKDGILNWLKEFDLAEDILPDFSSNTGHTENFSSPLVLDLNANGTTSTFIAQSETYFDMDGDGFKERTSWTESTDGLLALDKNQDGIINNGSELFGNYTKLANGTLAKNGFEALSQYDLNKDNIIDNKDSIYAHLKVWSDTNSDGISTTDELKTLQELNISKINLTSTKTSTSEAYNKISDSSTFVQNDQTKTINDVWFYQNKSDTTYTYTKPIKESVAVLPTIEGSGRVKNLQDAMNDDSVLEAKVTSLTQNASSQTFRQFSASFKDMVARWSGTDTISASATRGAQYVQNHNYGNPSALYAKEVYAYARIKGDRLL